jgi:hypothetical protein
LLRANGPSAVTRTRPICSTLPFDGGRKTIYILLTSSLSCFPTTNSLPFLVPLPNTTLSLSVPPPQLTTHIYRSTQRISPPIYRQPNYCSAVSVPSTTAKRKKNHYHVNVGRNLSGHSHGSTPTDEGEPPWRIIILPTRSSIVCRAASFRGPRGS